MEIRIRTECQQFKKAKHTYRHSTINIPVMLKNKFFTVTFLNSFHCNVKISVAKPVEPKLF